MSTRPDPGENLRRAAEWVDRNYRALSTLEKVAAEVRFQAKVVLEAGGDPNGRRVAALRERLARLREVIAELEETGP